jgi:hypothetical protein
MKWWLKKLIAETTTSRWKVLFSFPTFIFNSNFFVIEASSSPLYFWAKIYPNATFSSNEFFGILEVSYDSAKVYNMQGKQSTAVDLQRDSPIRETQKVMPSFHSFFKGFHAFWEKQASSSFLCGREAHTHWH